MQFSTMKEKTETVGLVIMSRTGVVGIIGVDVFEEDAIVTVYGSHSTTQRVFDQVHSRNENTQSSPVTVPMRCSRKRHRR